MSVSIHAGMLHTKVLMVFEASGVGWVEALRNARNKVKLNRFPINWSARLANYQTCLDN